MALNRRYEDARNIPLDVSGVTGSGAGGLCLSGDPGVVGVLPFVCLTDEDTAGDTIGFATVDTGGAYVLEVEADAGGGGVAVGDRVYFAAGVLSDVNTGVSFGVVIEDSLAAGATGDLVIKVGA